MIKVFLPEEKSIIFNIDKLNGFDIIKELNIKGCFLAWKVDGVLKDLRDFIYEDSNISLIKLDGSEDSLDIMRHDTAHLLAQAVQDLFPEVKVAIGPTIKDGFYYDFSTENSFSNDDLLKIEERMLDLAKKDYIIEKRIVERKQAVDLFKKQDEFYKLEIIDSIPQSDDICLYSQGNFIDLCRGPHGPSTGYLKHFKLIKVSGAYWRGDSKNKMLQRIYGTAWHSKEKLDEYIKNIEEAKKRDHRLIGIQMDLFHLQEESKGGVFWHSRGWCLYLNIQNYIREKLKKSNYLEIKTPSLVDSSLWKKSGHWDKFRENMFTTNSGDENIALKPMSCPCHIQVFNEKIRSYKELPIRFSEFGSCCRNEPSGSLHGLMRVREFVQDDGHIFCTEDQITEETLEFCKTLEETYKDFGFNDFFIRFSDRPEKRSGSDEVWDKSENALKEAINKTNFKYEINSGEGAFYGPKLEFVLKDAIGRLWQCGTLQIDFILPERLSAKYIDCEGNKKSPVIIHRAIIGTFERFIGVLLEHHYGNIPFFVTPVQVVLATVTSDVIEYADKIFCLLNQYRVISDFRNEKISYKIRQHVSMKVPFIWIIGAKEKQNNTVAVRFKNNTNIMSLEDAISELYNRSYIY